MLPIYICDDQTCELNILTEYVNDYTCFHFDSIRPDIYTYNNPNDLLEELQQNKRTGIYLLDYNLNNEINGISLALKIRKHDPLGFIIFVTSYSECAPLTFKFQVGALAYIPKDKPGLRESITEALNCAYSRYNTYLSIDNSKVRSVLKIDLNGQYYDFEYHDIIYICMSGNKQHKVEIHTLDQTFSFYSTIDSIEEQLVSDQFYRCNRSTLINLKHVTHYDKNNRVIRMIDGFTTEVPKRKLLEVFTKIKEV